MCYYLLTQLVLCLTDVKDIRLQTMKPAE